MKLTPRPYQKEAADSVKAAWRDFQSVLIVSPTASGKSVIFSELALYVQPQRVLVLANRGELIFQAARHVARAGLEASIEKADLSAGTGQWNKTPVVVASVQTLISKDGISTRMHKFDPKEFGLIICDEADLFIAKSFQSILNYFKNGNPNIKIFGCTATPNRQDEKALGQVFQTCSFKYEIIDAINDGWIMPVRPLALRVEGMDLTEVHTERGDLNSSELAAVMEAEKPLYGVAQGVLEAAFMLEPSTLFDVPVARWSEFLMEPQTPPRTTLCFTVSVAQAEMLSEIFNRVVPGIAEWVSGKTATDTRDDVNKRFINGELPFLVNCATHTTGFDAPRAEIIVPKPTKSWRLYCQMIGRGFRPPEVNGRSIVDQYETAEERKAAIARSRKSHCLVIDNYGVCGKHKLITPFDILGGNYSQEVIEMAVERAREKGVPVNMTEEMIEAEKALKKKMEDARLMQQSRKQKLMGRSKFIVSAVNPFDRYDLTPMQMLPKAEKVVSPGMAKILRIMRVDPYSILYDKALRMVREFYGNQKRKRK